MKKVICDTYHASAVIGLQKGYSGEMLTMEAFRAALLKAQAILKDNTGILLSVKLTPCEIVFLGQEEPSVTLEFINYPRYPLPYEQWKHGVLTLTEHLMRLLHQNRVVVVFPGETVMFEESEATDPRIRL